MMKDKKIKEIVNKIKEKFNPQKIILFGSYAWGRPTEDSDIDLLVVMDTDLRPPQQAVLIRKELPSYFAWDIIVRTPQQLKRRIKEGDFFLKTILDKGKIL